MDADNRNDEIANYHDGFFDWVEQSALFVQDYFGSYPEASVDEVYRKLLEKKPRLATMEAWGEKDIKEIIIELRSDNGDTEDE